MALSSVLHGPGPSYKGAPPWATSFGRSFYNERCADLWVLYTYGDLNAYEVNQIVRLSNRNQTATRLGEARTWGFCGAVLLGGGLWYGDLRGRSDFATHPTGGGRSSGGTVHRITPLGVTVLQEIEWIMRQRTRVLRRRRPRLVHAVA